MTTQPTPAIQSLDRGLRLLEAVAKSRRPVPLAELTPVLGIDRSSVFRLANTLKQRGFLGQLPEGKGYVLGAAVWRLAQLFPWSDVLAEFAREQVAELARQTGETTHLAVREGSQAALLEHYLTEKPVGCALGSGECIPLYCTSVGRALVADYDRDQLVALLGEGPFPSFNRRTLRSPEALAEECRKTRKRGFALDDQEYHEGVRCIAAPIRDNTGAVVASIGISAPIKRLAKNRISETGRLVIEVADQIGEKLGYSLSVP